MCAHAQERLTSTAAAATESAIDRASATDAGNENSEASSMGEALTDLVQNVPLHS